ncbi:MAG: acyltransferase domain-containing protein [Burkholderiaceae bacterium]|nr:acyltransferase domain-containing protein [Burkholderiaceae bacterium]
MGYALLFSGQAGQHPDMLSWLQPDETVEAVERRLGADWRQRLADPAWAGDNARAQCLITGLSLAVCRQLAAELGPPAIVAGYSVGELAAFAAAGVFDAATALQLAERRAACMDAAAAAVRTGLMGLHARNPDELCDLCGRFDLDLAIRLGPGSAVVGGPVAALAAAAQHAEEVGLRATPLNVALASHTRWMRPALAPFAAVLDQAVLARPALPLVSNALGRIHSARQAREALVRQIAEPVRWDECLDLVQAQRVEVVLEIGPGQALARIWNERHPAIPARSADEFRSRSTVLAWAGRHLAMR